MDVIESQFLSQLICFPTHIKGNILDLLLTDQPENVINVESIGNLGNSDHDLIKVELNFNSKPNISSEMVRNWRKGDQPGLINCISEINFEQIFQNKDANQCWLALKEVTQGRH